MKSEGSLSSSDIQFKHCSLSGNIILFALEKPGNLPRFNL